MRQCQQKEVRRHRKHQAFFPDRQARFALTEKHSVELVDIDGGAFVRDVIALFDERLTQPLIQWNCLSKTAHLSKTYLLQNPEQFLSAALLGGNRIVKKLLQPLLRAWRKARREKFDLFLRSKQWCEQALEFVAGFKLLQNNKPEQEFRFRLRRPHAFSKDCRQW